MKKKLNNAQIANRGYLRQEEKFREGLRRDTEAAL